MRLQGTGDEGLSIQTQGVSAPAPAAEQAPVAEAAEHDHAQRLQERPLMFASAHMGEAALRAQLDRFLSDDGDAASAGPAMAQQQQQQAGASAMSAVEQRAPTAAAAEPALDRVRDGGELLRAGSSGPAVEALQQALNAAGIEPPLEVDGRFDAEMASAVRRFQEANGCLVDGIVGPETLGAIDGARGLEPHPEAAAASARYAARRSGGGARGAGGDDGGPGGAGSARRGGASGDVSLGPTAGGTDLSSVDRIIDRTVRFESGGRYDAWNADDNGHGVSFGIIQFNQQVGGLPRLLDRMHDADPARFAEIMGPHAANLQDAEWVRSADLNAPDLRERLQRAGRDPVFQQVQRDLAREQYFEPAERLAAEHGITSERGLAMLFDSCVQNGVGGTRRFLAEAREGGGDERAVLERFAEGADRGRAGRRTRILNEEGFSDGPPGSGGAGGGAAASATDRHAGEATAGSAPPTGDFGAGAGAGRSEGAGGAGSVEATSGAAAVRGAGPIGPGTRVLMIGDSHSVGAFGNEMDRLLRATGATVESYGSAGSSPSWWLNGTTTRSGFVARRADGTVERPDDWRTPTETPRLAELIREHQPDVLMVELGGNMRGLSDEAVRRQVRQLAEVARENGTRLVWVGPPERRADDADGRAYQRFNALLREAVEPYGSFVDSSRYTDYAGGDGVHYTGARGTEIARSWAASALDEIQERSRADAAGSGGGGGADRP